MHCHALWARSAHNTAFFKKASQHKPAARDQGNRGARTRLWPSIRGTCKVPSRIQASLAPAGMDAHRHGCTQTWMHTDTYPQRPATGGSGGVPAVWHVQREGNRESAQSARAPVLSCLPAAQPDNFLFVTNDPDSQLKAIDFGLSIRHWPSEPKLTSRSGAPRPCAPPWTWCLLCSLPAQQGQA